jgi:hypothetical protein
VSDKYVKFPEINIYSISTPALSGERFDVVESVRGIRSVSAENNQLDFNVINSLCSSVPIHLKQHSSLSVFCSLLLEGTFTSFFKDKKS